MSSDLLNLLFNMVATGPMHLFIFKLIKMKYNYKFKSLVTLATVQVLNSHVLLVVILLDDLDAEPFRYHRLFSRAVLC